MSQPKPRRSNPPGGKAGVIADIEERWFIPAPKVKRVMDGLVKVWKDALLRGEEVPMPGGVAQVTWRKPVCPLHWPGRSAARQETGAARLEVESHQEPGEIHLVPREPAAGTPERRDLRPAAGGVGPQPPPDLEARRAQTGAVERAGQQKRKGPKPPPEPEPLMLPRDAKTVAENRAAYYRRMEKERASGVTQPTDRYQVPSRTDMFRRGRR